MHKRALLSQIFLMLLSLVTIAEAAMPEHQHNAATKESVCDQHNTLPALRCANTPSAVFDSAGRLWLAWVFSGHVYVNYSDDKGLIYSAPVVVNTNPENIYARGENRPKIVVSSNGQINVSWTQKLAKRFSGYIRFSRSIDNGKHFSDPITVNDHQEITGHRFDAMAVDENGDIYIAWLDKRDLLSAKKSGQAYNGAAVYFSVSKDAGVSFQPNKKIIDNSCQCCRVVMAVDKDQLPVILWRHIYGENIRDHALVKLDADMKVGQVHRVSYDQWQIDACPHHGPDISIDEAGVYHLVWFNNAPDSHGLFYANTNNQGKSISTPVSFGNYKLQAAHPQVLSVTNKVFVLWKEFDGKQSTLNMMKSSDSGRTWTEPMILNKTSANSDHPLLINNGNSVYAAWHRRGENYRLLALTND